MYIRICIKNKQKNAKKRQKNKMKIAKKCIMDYYYYYANYETEYYEN